jgi:hypothetical protein
LGVTAEASCQRLVVIGTLAAHSRVAVDDVLSTEFADFLCNGGDNVAAEFLSLEAELVLLGHVAASKSSDLVHDVEENSLGRTIALGGVLGGVTNVSACDVHGAVGGEGDAVRDLLAPAYTCQT